MAKLGDYVVETGADGETWLCIVTQEEPLRLKRVERIQP